MTKYVIDYRKLLNLILIIVLAVILFQHVKLRILNRQIEAQKISIVEDLQKEIVSLRQKNEAKTKEIEANKKVVDSLQNLPPKIITRYITIIKGIEALPPDESLAHFDTWTHGENPSVIVEDKSLVEHSRITAANVKEAQYNEVGELLDVAYIVIEKQELIIEQQGFIIQNQKEIEEMYIKIAAAKDVDIKNVEKKLRREKFKKIGTAIIGGVIIVLLL